MTSKHFSDNFLKESKVKFLLNFSILVELKLKNSFQDSLRLFCNCRASEIELSAILLLLQVFPFQCFK